MRSETKDEGGSLEDSQISIPYWLFEVRELFPKETCEIIEIHALERYGMTELVTEPKVLEKLTPNEDLLKTILTFRGLMTDEVLGVPRKIIKEVVEEIKRKLENEIRQTLAGKLNRFQHSPLKVSQNFDWRGTIRRNLKHYDPERQKISAQNLRFFSRVERRLTWNIILCVDQSGSMLDSVIHSQVMAGILSRLPTVKAHLVVFDTNVVDLSEFVNDAVEVLMSVQLGGGTDIGQAMKYCENLITIPHRSIVILVSDFCEGGSPNELLATVKRLKEANVQLLGLAALDQTANPSFDHQMAQRLADCGMEIAALTPKKLAEWLAKVIK
jgi:Mg-chelatase subunit ChlD